MLGSVKIGAAISKSISGFPVGATVAVTKLIGFVGQLWVLPFLSFSRFVYRTIPLSSMSFNADLGNFFFRRTIAQRFINFRRYP
jgi:hypothetical protein